MKNHSELQEEILANGWKYWQMELDEMIDELGGINYVRCCVFVIYF